MVVQPGTRQKPLLLSGRNASAAAALIARQMGLDLFRIDLSAVVSQFLGDTEKNLKRLFDDAETDSKVLLLDEAEALFGKRTEVRNAHARYAKTELALLLQRIEGYKGATILVSRSRLTLPMMLQRRFRIYGFPPSAVG